MGNTTSDVAKAIASNGAKANGARNGARQLVLNVREDLGRLQSFVDSFEALSPISRHYLLQLLTALQRQPTAGARVKVKDAEGGFPSELALLRRGRPCAENYCPNNSIARGLCAGHWRQQRRGEPLRPLPGRGLPGLPGAPLDEAAREHLSRITLEHPTSLPKHLFPTPVRPADAPLHGEADHA